MPSQEKRRDDASSGHVANTRKLRQDAWNTEFLT